MANSKSKKSASEARVQSEAWEPLSKHEREAARARGLVGELEAAQHELAANDDQKKALKAHIRELKRAIKIADRMSRPARARINKLDRQWRRQWLKFYDEEREERGRTKAEAAALAWSRVKVHCEQDADGAWICPPWAQVYGAVAKGRLPKGISATTRKKVKAQMKGQKKKAKKGP